MSKAYAHINILIDAGLRQAIEKYCRRQEITVSSMIREAVAGFLDARQNKAAQTPQEARNEN